MRLIFFFKHWAAEMINTIIEKQYFLLATIRESAFSGETIGGGKKRFSKR